MVCRHFCGWQSPSLRPLCLARYWRCRGLRPQCWSLGRVFFLLTITYCWDTVNTKMQILAVTNRWNMIRRMKDRKRKKYVSGSAFAPRNRTFVSTPLEYILQFLGKDQGFGSTAEQITPARAVRSPEQVRRWLNTSISPCVGAASVIEAWSHLWTEKSNSANAFSCVADVWWYHWIYQSRLVSTLFIIVDRAGLSSTSSLLQSHALSPDH